MPVAAATFALASVLIVLLPGPDTLVVVRSLVRGGRPRGVSTALGVLAGLVVWVAVAALGLTALLRASEVGYSVLRFAGAAYLLWLGVQSLRTRMSGPSSAQSTVETRGGVLGTGFVAGLLTDLLNPKVGVFFVTFLPAFVPTGWSVGVASLLFGAIFVVLTAGYFAVLLGLAARVTDWMATPRVRRRLDVLTGGVLVAFGVRLATES